MINARDRVRAYFKRPARFFFTAAGRKNYTTGNMADAMYFATDRGGGHRISKEKIVQAVYGLLVKRTMTRKQLEKFSPFSSALLGLLRSVLGLELKMTQLKTGAFVITMKGTRFCFTGVDRSKRDFEVAAANGAEVAFVNYAHCRNDKTEKFLEYSRGKPLVVDSGAFTVWMASLDGKHMEPIDIYAYITFLKKHADRILYYFNLDVIGDASASRRNAEIMRAHGMEPVQVWHINFQDTRVEAQNWDGLDRLIREGHIILGIGGSAKTHDKHRLPIYQELFRRYPDQNFHILGLGSPKILRQLPDLFACDARTWVKGREVGRLLTDDGQKQVGKGIDVMAANVRYLASLAYGWA
jgi:hypothetical protein